MCARAVFELLPQYANYCWNRMMIVSAEDCHGIITGEIVALYDAWYKATQGPTKTNSTKQPLIEGRIFFAKAIILLAYAQHSRDADELVLLVANRIPDQFFDEAVAECEQTLTVDDEDFEIPEYVYDVHTQLGKKMGRTRKQFVKAEHDALRNRRSVLTNFDEMAASDEYVAPEFDWG